MSEALYNYVRGKGWIQTIEPDVDWSVFTNDGDYRYENAIYPLGGPGVFWYVVDLIERTISNWHSDCHVSLPEGRYRWDYYDPGYKRWTNNSPRDFYTSRAILLEMGSRETWAKQDNRYYRAVRVA